jgi:hypothetical protein
MTWFDVAGAHPIYTLAAVLGLAALICCGFALNRTMRRREELDELDADLDADTYVLELTHDETLLGVAEESAVLDSNVPAVLDVPEDAREGRDLPVLTPKQRRRAVHKGRIPRDLPAPASTPAPGGGENHERLIGGVLAAELETGRLVATMRDEARQAEAAAVWAEIGGLVDDAYRWWAAPGRWELAA